MERMNNGEREKKGVNQSCTVYCMRHKRVKVKDKSVAEERKDKETGCNRGKVDSAGKKV